MAEKKAQGKTGVLFVCLGELGDLLAALFASELFSATQRVKLAQVTSAGALPLRRSSRAKLRPPASLTPSPSTAVAPAGASGIGTLPAASLLRLLHLQFKALPVRRIWPVRRYKGAPSYHEGGPADERMIAAAAKRRIDVTSRSRPLKAADLQSFDYILGMDYENAAAIQVAADYWAGEGANVPAGYRDKASSCLFCHWSIFIPRIRVVL